MTLNTSSKERTNGLSKIKFFFGLALGFVIMQSVVFWGVRSSSRQLLFRTDPSSDRIKIKAASLRFEEELRQIEHAASNNITAANQSSPWLIAAASTTTSTKTEEGQQEASLDSVFQLPFYIYDNELDWSVNATIFRGANHSEWLNQSGFLNYKHSDDYWLLYHAKQHPMRTFNPREADLFFVPTLLSVWNFYGFQGDDSQNKFCAHNGICNLQLLKRAEQLLLESKWYQRSQGRDHIVVDSHWRKHWKQISGSRLLNCNSISFENRVPKSGNAKQYQVPTGGRVHIPSFYVGRPCPSSSHANKTHDFALIASLKPNNPNFRDRSHVCNWLRQRHHNYTVSVCGQGNQCPALGQARFGFHVRGDTWGSNRLMDTLLTGAIPLVTSAEQIKILPDFVPWEDVSYTVKVSSEAAFDASLQSILQKSEQELQEKRTNISKHMDTFNHKKRQQFDLYMHRFAQKLNLY
ncbi:unknown protein [Seminavis robusta]|uniref:Exostosin GT47 domain-containing protein n=1 Tax=Seminavis robusta TaxID=568900 RepID=A0A9N8EMF0_9STRA|nr:unknown protein [Seminavis robusta]|eukprot:Sro1333_g263700.1 n/a (464) ;mRNA; r:20636-22027